MNPRSITPTCLVPATFLLCLLLPALLINAPAEAQLGSCGIAAGYFQVDGQFYSQNGTNDWAQGDFGQGVLDDLGNEAVVSSLHDRDAHWAGNAVDPNHFAGNGNKNNDDISLGEQPWSWGPGSGPSKNDLTDVYAHSAILNGDIWLFLGAMTRATNGASHIDFEFNQLGFNLTGTTSGQVIGNGPDAGRTADVDFIVSVDYTSGGNVPVISCRRWEAVGSGYEFVLQGADPNNVFVCTNDQTIPAPPWGAVAPDGTPSNQVVPFQFVEIALNLSAMGIDPSVFCSDVSTLLFKTRSAPSFTASLKDLALYQFSIFPAPDCSITADLNPICEGVSTSLCAPEAPEGSDYTYSWSGPGGPYPDARCITVSEAGEYGLVIFDNLTGCESAGCTFELGVNPLPECNITFDTDVICDGGSARFCGPEAPGGTSYSYLWSGPGGSYPDARCIDVSAEGTYSLTVVDQSTGCSSSSTCEQTLTVNPLPTASIEGAIQICEGGSTEFCGPEGNFEYAWTGPDNFSSSDQCIMVDTQGTYSLVVTDIGTGCSSRSVEHELEVNGNPECSIEGPDSVCPDGEIELCGPEGEFTYAWTGPSEFVSDQRCVTVSEPGLYTLTLGNGSGCESVCEHEVSLDENVSAGNLEDLWICTGDRAEFCVTATGTGPLTYVWKKDGQVIEGSDGNCLVVDPIAAADAGRYSVTVAGKCSEVTRSADLELADVTVEELRNLYYCEGQTVEFCPDVEGRGPFTYIWTRDGEVVGNDRCLTLEDVTQADEGEYCLEVQGFCGEPVRRCATLLVGTCEEFCGLTQGFYGNPGGKWNGLTTLELLDTLITEENPLVLGVFGRSLTFPEGSEECIITYLPGGGPSVPLPADMGNAVVDPSDCSTTPSLQARRGRIRNNLLAQTITTSLNARLDPELGSMELCSIMIMIGTDPGPDGELGTGDDLPDNDDVRIRRISDSVFEALDFLGLPHTVDGLLMLANRLLADQLAGLFEINLGDVTSALGSINDMVDECALTIHCESDFQDDQTPDERNHIASLEDGSRTRPVFGVALRSRNPLRAGDALRVQFSLPEDSRVQVSLFDLNGRKLRTMLDETRSQGVQETGLQLGDQRLAGGIYFLKVSAKGLSTGQTMVKTSKVVVIP